MVEIVKKYFENLDGEKYSKIKKLQEVYEFWNAQINVISRKDMEMFYIHHVLHSLSLIELIEKYKPKSIVDIGTGGGFPGIPLAIYFPEIKFILVDSIGKKIKVVNEVKDALNLNNIVAENLRIENIKQKADLAITRAVAPLSELQYWLKNAHLNQIPMLCLKGGDLLEEISEFKYHFPKRQVTLTNLNEKFVESYFETKKIVEVW